MAVSNSLCGGGALSVDYVNTSVLSDTKWLRNSAGHVRSAPLPPLHSLSSHFFARGCAPHAWSMPFDGVARVLFDALSIVIPTKVLPISLVLPLEPHITSFSRPFPLALAALQGGAIIVRSSTSLRAHRISPSGSAHSRELIAFCAHHTHVHQGAVRTVAHRATRAYFHLKALFALLPPYPPSAKPGAEGSVTTQTTKIMSENTQNTARKGNARTHKRSASPFSRGGMGPPFYGGFLRTCPITARRRV